MAHTKPPLKILMLHGYTQSGLLFRGKTGALTKAITKAFPLHAVSFSYPTGPLRLNPSDVPGYTPSNNAQEEETEAEAEIESYGWWRRANSTVPPVEYKGIDDAFRAIAQVLRDEGPFDGVIGFSQGASLAFAVASLLEIDRKKAFASVAATQKRNKKQEDNTNTENKNKNNDDDDFFPQWFLPEHTNNHPPLKFGIVYSGFRFADERFRALYDEPVRTPVLHVMGTLDALVSEAMSRALVEACAGGDSDVEKRVVFHPGGHFVPSQKTYLDIAVGFVRTALEQRVNGEKKEEEERVEDMDVPF